MRPETEIVKFVVPIALGALSAPQKRTTAQYDPTTDAVKLIGIGLTCLAIAAFILGGAGGGEQPRDR
jgi:hypothetical protein